MVQALAAELKPTFVVVRGPEIFSKWLGDTEEAVRHIFELARRMPPAIVFFDQLEAIAPIRGADAGSGRPTGWSASYLPSSTSSALRTGSW